MAETTSPLVELHHRLSASAEPDRQIDAEIWAAIQGRELVEFDDSGTGENLTTSGPLRFPDWVHPSKMTESLDRALSTVQRCGFSNCAAEARFVPGVPSEARIQTYQADRYGTVGRGPSFKGRHEIPAIAVMLALLDALINLPGILEDA